MVAHPHATSHRLSFASGRDGVYRQIKNRSLVSGVILSERNILAWSNDVNLSSKGAFSV